MGRFLFGQACLKKIYCQRVSKFGYTYRNLSRSASCPGMMHQKRPSSLQEHSLWTTIRFRRRWTKRWEILKNMNLLKISRIKFRFFKKATKFETISHMIWHLLSKCQIKWEIFSNFCDLCRMSELYQQFFLQILTKVYRVFSRKTYWPDCFNVLLLVLLLSLNDAKISLSFELKERHFVFLK